MIMLLSELTSIDDFLGFFDENEYYIHFQIRTQKWQKYQNSNCNYENWIEKIGRCFGNSKKVHKLASGE